jgi:hypothetical protein
MNTIKVCVVLSLLTFVVVDFGRDSTPQKEDNRLLSNTIGIIAVKYRKLIDSLHLTN